MAGSEPEGRRRRRARSERCMKEPGWRQERRQASFSGVNWKAPASISTDGAISPLVLLEPGAGVHERVEASVAGEGERPEGRPHERIGAEERRPWARPRLGRRGRGRREDPHEREARGQHHRRGHDLPAGQEQEQRRPRAAGRPRAARRGERRRPRRWLCAAMAAAQASRDRGQHDERDAAHAGRGRAAGPRAGAPSGAATLTRRPAVVDRPVRLDRVAPSTSKVQAVLGEVDREAGRPCPPTPESPARWRRSSCSAWSRCRRARGRAPSRRRRRTSPIRERAACPRTISCEIGARVTATPLADQPGQVGQRPAERAAERREQRLAPARRSPGRPRTRPASSSRQHVAGDEDDRGEGQPAHIDAVGSCRCRGGRP